MSDPSRWLFSFAANKALGLVASKAFQFMLPTILALGTAFAGYFQEVPISYAIAASALTFVSIIISIATINNILIFYDTKYKLVPIDPNVRFFVDQKQLQFWINLINKSHHLIEYKATSVQSIVGNIINKKKRDHLDIIFPSFPEIVAIYLDDCIEFSENSGAPIECIFTISIDYGRAGNLSHKIEKSYLIFISFSQDKGFSYEWRHNILK